MSYYDDILNEKDQNKRIDLILTDAHDEYEQQEAFCCFIVDNISFPFEARIRNEKRSELFTVLEFTSVEPHRVVCKIDLKGFKSRMPFTEIDPIENESVNSIVIKDYLKFIGI